MSTVQLSPSPLPRRMNKDASKVAYDIVLDAESYANNQLEASQEELNQATKAGRGAAKKAILEAKENLIFARVAGYLLIELFIRRGVLTNRPYQSLVKQLTSPPRNGGTAHDVVIQVGKWHFDHLLRMCTFGLPFKPSGISVSSQTVRSPNRTQHPLYTLRVLPSTTWRR